MNIVDRLAVAAIICYQRHLSPRKGFCCAHRAWYGGSSCSEYARLMLNAAGFRRALPLIGQRLRACQHAARNFIADQDDAEERRKRRRDNILECLPDACPDVWPDSCDGGCVPDACSRLWVNRSAKPGKLRAGCD